MKYMGKFYSRMTRHELEVLRSKKYNRQQRLDREAKTYLNLKELNKLTQQIAWIDAEINSRKDQTAFDWQ